MCLVQTVIRLLGGLLSCYDLSGDDMFLKKATDLADRLLPYFLSGSGKKREHGAFKWSWGLKRASINKAVGNVCCLWEGCMRGRGGAQYSACCFELMLPSS